MSANSKLTVNLSKSRALRKPLRAVFAGSFSKSSPAIREVTSAEYRLLNNGVCVSQFTGSRQNNFLAHLEGDDPSDCELEIKIQRTGGRMCIARVPVAISQSSSIKTAEIDLDDENLKVPNPPPSATAKLYTMREVGEELKARNLSPTHQTRVKEKVEELDLRTEKNEDGYLAITQETLNELIAYLTTRPRLHSAKDTNSDPGEWICACQEKIPWHIDHCPKCGRARAMD
jgi:hypothetical protein